MRHTIIATVLIIIILYVPEKDLMRAIACGGVYVFSLIAEAIYEYQKSKEEQSRNMVNAITAIAMDFLAELREKKK